MTSRTARSFDLAMRKCGVQPDEALMVGDNFTHDVCGAHEAGISGIWLNWTHKERPESEVGCFEAHDFLEAAGSHPHAFLT